MKKLTYYSASFFLFAFFIFSCNLFDKNKDEPVSVQNLKNIVTGSPIEVANSPVGLAGASIKISKPGTPVDGMKITIPANSFPSVQTVKVVYSEIKSHQFGQYFNPISPMITISCDGGYSTDIMSVTIPVKIPEGQIAIGFFLDEETGTLEGIPFKSVNSNSITLLTRHFLSGNKLKSGDITLKKASAETNRGANIIISSISESILNLQPVIASGFKPGVDDWEGTVATMFGKYIDKNQEMDKLKLYTIAGAMLVTGEPQGIGIYMVNGAKPDGTPIYGGHDLICYQVSVSGGKLYISDPNTPGTEQTIDFSNNKFKPYSQA